MNKQYNQTKTPSRILIFLTAFVVLALAFTTATTSSMFSFENAIAATVADPFVPGSGPTSDCRVIGMAVVCR